MRKFKVVIINPMKDEEGGEKYRGEVIHLTPILSEHYKILGDTFRCTEHKKGSLKLINDGYLLFLKEVW